MTYHNYANYQVRLTSYNEKNWPNSCPIYIKELVEAGFVYTGFEELVFCFRCGVSINNWKENDVPLARHQELNKQCPFLLDRSTKISPNESKVTTNRQFKSLEDYERESLLFDWDSELGVVQRNKITQASTSEESMLNLNTGGGRSENNNEKFINMLQFDLSKLGNEVMRYERRRYQTFACCPVNKHWPSPEDLSKAGFYFLSDRNRMSCFCCGLKVEDWESSHQDPMVRHRSLSPDCLYVKGSMCGNIVDDGEESALTPAFAELGVSNSNVTASRLADVDISFPYHNEPVTRVHSEPLNVLNNENIIAHPNLSESYSSNYPPNYMHNRNLNERTQPFAYPPSENVAPPYNPPLLPPHQYGLQDINFADLSKRLQTFLTWPKDAPIQPLELAKAGFIYTGRRDGVRCYSCDISLRQWDENDEAWSEHSKFSPSCPLVIERLRENIGINHRNEAVPNSVIPNTSSNIAGQRIPHSRQYSLHNPHVSHETGEPRFDNPMVQNNMALRQHRMDPYLPNDPNGMNHYPINIEPRHIEPNDYRLKLTPLQQSYLYEQQIRSEFARYPQHNSQTLPGYHVVSARPTNDYPTMNYEYQDNRYQVPPLSIQQDTRNIDLRNLQEVYGYECNVSPIQSVSSSPVSLDYSKNLMNTDSKNFIDSHKNSDSSTLSLTKENTSPLSSIPQNDLDKILDAGFSKDLVQQTIQCYLRYSPKSFTSLDDLAQAVMYFRQYGNLEGSLFGENLAVESTEDGKNMVSGKLVKKSIIDDTTDGKICKVCMDNDVEITFVPCGHLIVCKSCALDMTKCPICRINITNTVRTYLC